MHLKDAMCIATKRKVKTGFLAFHDTLLNINNIDNVYIMPTHWTRFVVKWFCSGLPTYRYVGYKFK